MKRISSVQNPIIKSLVQLQEKARNRKNSGLFLVEGQREIGIALKGNYAIKKLFFCPDYISEKEFSLLGVSDQTEIVEITKEIYQKLAYRDTTEGIIGVAEAKSHTLDNLFLSKNPLILVAESPEKPGNLGALLRTADAAGIDAVIIANPKTDLYNPNVVRSSVGCVFTNQIAMANTDEVIAYLQKHKIAIYSAVLQEAVSYETQDYTSSAAIVVGTEATGLTEPWRKNAHKNIIIPMGGTIDSMNVSVAAAILLFEAKRQRGF